MNKNQSIENIDEILTKEEILKLYENVVEGAKPIMLAKDVCKCGCGDCSCTGNSSSTKGCCG